MDKPLKPPPSKKPSVQSPPAKSRSRRGFVTTTIIVLLVVAGVVWWTRQQPAPQPQGRGAFSRNAPPGSVVDETIGKGDINLNLNALGTVTSLATVTIRSQISGYLIKIDFKEGDEVKKGDLIAEIDSRPYEAAL